MVLLGENTEAAVKAFQRSVGLKDDGIVGKNTRTKLGLS
jgi:peptidoglycan hydrolase-like protein with peptidoglycan-binding domain